MTSIASVSTHSICHSPSVNDATAQKKSNEDILDKYINNAKSRDNYLYFRTKPSHFKDRTYENYERFLTQYEECLKLYQQYQAATGEEKEKLKNELKEKLKGMANQFMDNPGSQEDFNEMLVNMSFIVERANSFHPVDFKEINKLVIDFTADATRDFPCASDNIADHTPSKKMTNNRLSRHG